MSHLLAPEGNTADIGHSMHRLVGELYPICRSITGDGVRQTLRSLQDLIPLTIEEVPSGTAVFDWTVPQEWNIRDAYIKSSRGERLVDFRESNLHVVGYSRPVRARLRFDELRDHLFTLPEHPTWIPYRTSYYNDDWGFCLTHEQLVALERRSDEENDEEYEVCIDATLADGHLTYGECYLPGETAEEVLLSCHVCHPSLANDNLSGIALATSLARRLEATSRRYSYRLLFIPGTIGSITWLALNEARVPQIEHGFVLAGVGDAGPFSYKRSRRGDATIDRVFAHVLEHGNDEHALIDFYPYGYDERQYCSPGFDLPVGCVSRTPHGRYPEYHTSADDPGFVEPEALADSFRICWAALSILEGDQTYVNLNPKCEPQLGKRGLYKAIGGQAESGVDQMALLWILNLSDGRHSLLDIAERANLPFATVRAAADALLECDLLREAGALEPTAQR